MSGNRWIPLESNPEVLNSWSQKAGLDLSHAWFEDVYGVDPELLSFVSQPVKAVVLLFPITESLENKRKEEDKKITDDGQTLPSNVFWIKQTISNACGTIGLLHALANSNVIYATGSPLEQFIKECQDKTPGDRAKLLETTPLFADIHAEAASGGQTEVPTNLDTDLHFTCFIRVPLSKQNANDSAGKYRIVEMDGRRVGPIDRGERDDDFLNGVANVIKNHYLENTTSIQFSMVALCSSAKL